MNLNLYISELGYRLVAENIFGEKAEMDVVPGDGIYEYVRMTGRLNVSYVVYWLTNPPKGFRMDKNRKEFLEFLNRANDHRRVRRVTRPEGWREYAGLSKGEVPHHYKKPGDVVVHGDCARADLVIL
jgi:hypothetical protein